MKYLDYVECEYTLLYNDRPILWIGSTRPDEHWYLFLLIDSPDGVDEYAYARLTIESFYHLKEGNITLREFLQASTPYRGDDLPEEDWYIDDLLEDVELWGL